MYVKQIYTLQLKNVGLGHLTNLRQVRRTHTMYGVSRDFSLPCLAVAPSRVFMAFGIDMAFSSITFPDSGLAPRNLDVVTVI